MATIVKRVVGVLLALVGLALTAVGVWFATQLGTSGTAEFAVHPATTDPVVVGPDVLNRVDADVVVTATPTEGGTVWMALANPSDANAVVGDTRHVAVTGVSVSDWSLLTTTTGTGAAPELGVADLWRQQDDAKGPVTLTVQQSGAPETLVVKTDGGQLSSLTLKVTDKSWFVEAVVAALIGLFLLVAGVVLATSRRRYHHHVDVVVPPVLAGPGTIEPDRAVGAQDGTEPTVPLEVPLDHPGVASPLQAPTAPDPADGPDRLDGHDVAADDVPDQASAAQTTDPHDPHDPEEVTR